MTTFGAKLPLTYRREIAAPLFDLLRGGESAAIVGPASMGKSRLLQFLQRPDVQQHYLGEEAARTWLVLVDCHRLAEVSEWGLYELMLTSLTEEAGQRLDAAMRGWLNDLRREAITGANPLLARRHLELATRVLCREHGLRLCIVFDEFDQLYRTLPATALANLRALRDMGKQDERYSVCYVLMVRDHPARLRPPAEVEGFYELFSRSVIGLKPFGEEDARRVIAQIVARRRRVVAPDQEAAVLALSGGHPGLLVALCDLLSNGCQVPAAGDLAAWALAQPPVAEECRKLWEGLADDERLALSRLAHGIGASYTLRELLALKGLIRPLEQGAVEFFSPVFRQYVLSQGKLSDRELWLDEGSAVVWVEGKPIHGLSPLEFKLLRHLYRRLGQVCTREEIMADLYAGEARAPGHTGGDNRVDTLVRRLRKAIEPDPERPRYLLTVRGHGYKLVDQAGGSAGDDERALTRAH
ncbi:MAG: winged helix-turn-helix domain-containing protein [Anaerolineae bacterium]|nr:winged helix-turn-helix domain-containing protein [Anaerolineae bacterium]